MKSSLLTLIAIGALVADAASGGPRPQVGGTKVGASAAGAARPRYDAAVLGRIVDRVRESHRKGRHPVVVLDLDDTLLQPNYRKKRILVDWAKRLPVPCPKTVAALERLDPETMAYDLRTSLVAAGITDHFQQRSAYRFWFKQFFSGRYLSEDRLVPGASAYVAALRDAGARIVYLTGRDRPLMQEGTIESLRSSGLPLPDATTRLHLKAHRFINDDLFKTIDMQQIRGLGTVVAGFDNEPRNCNIMRRFCPQATVVLLDTLHSDNPPPLDPGVWVVKNFLR